MTVAGISIKENVTKQTVILIIAVLIVVCGTMGTTTAEKHLGKQHDKKNNKIWGTNIISINWCIFNPVTQISWYNW